MYNDILKDTREPPQKREDKFVTQAITDVSFNQCSKCKHFNGSIRCKAFPNGIPMDIFGGKVDHSKPVKGDNGITFEPK